MSLKLPMKVEVEMSLFATVEITQEICDGIADQYPDSWDAYQENPEEIAKMILYASVNPYIHSSNKNYEDWWDGVGNMQGLITEMELT